MRAKRCQLSGCKNTTDHISGYCSDECLQDDMAPDYLPPVTVLSRNKSGGFGRDLCWQIPQYVHLPPMTEESSNEEAKGSS